MKTSHVLPAILSLALLLAACSTPPPEVLGGQLSTLHKEGIPATFAAALKFDREAKTITLPLFKGVGPKRKDVYYIITETSDFDVSVRGGVNWAPKLTNAVGTAAVQKAQALNRKGTPTQLRGRNVIKRLREGQVRVRFPGSVDFSPELIVVPGSEGFPLGVGTQPGSVGDAVYSPLFSTGDGLVFNATHVANATGLHDDVLAIDKKAMTVTLSLVDGFYEEAPVLYLSLDASDANIAALESGTFAPNMNAAPAAGDRDPTTSAREAIIPVVNGEIGVQGLRSAVAGAAGPFNIIREEQECSDPEDCSALLYSPLWDVHPVFWTEEAIASGQRQLLTSHVQVIDFFRQGSLVSFAPQGPANPKLGGLNAAGIIINCPNMFVDQNLVVEDAD